MKRPPDLPVVLTYGVFAAIVATSIAAGITFGLLAGAVALLVPLVIWWFVVTSRAHDLERARAMAEAGARSRAPFSAPERPDIPTTAAPVYGPTPGPAPWDGGA